MNRRAFLLSSFLLGVMHATGIRPQAVGELPARVGKIDPAVPGVPLGAKGLTVYYAGQPITWKNDGQPCVSVRWSEYHNGFIA